MKYVVRCAIWYHLYNLKNVKNTHGGVIILVKLQAEVCDFTKIDIVGLNDIYVGNLMTIIMTI